MNYLKYFLNCDPSTKCERYGAKRNKLLERFDDEYKLSTCACKTGCIIFPVVYNASCISDLYSMHLLIKANVHKCPQMSLNVHACPRVSINVHLECFFRGFVRDMFGTCSVALRQNGTFTEED